MSLTPLVTTVVPALSEGAAHEPAVSPYVVGVSVFGVLLVLMLGLLMFGAGRDHS
ncbi:hypothetical protein [Nocardioides iriomotensis]|uniref:hypothetical protein n=1 Tax=Nocardioides iriomotensis TaxID=715784 RepID=UPI0013EAF8D2|nr:hypothetical protein [Nocardioides iriomotensis]